MEDSPFDKLFGPGVLEAQSRLFALGQSSGEEQWRAFREAVAHGNSQFACAILNYIDWVWQDSNFAPPPGVLLLAQPYHNNYSKYHYVNTAQIHLELGCLIYKHHDGTHETLSQSMPDFLDVPVDVQYVDPMRFCPFCDSIRRIPHTPEHDSFAPLLRPRSWVHTLAHYLNSRIDVGIFDPKNIPPELQAVLSQPRYERPLQVKFCGQAVMCPGYRQVAARAARQKPSRAVSNFFKLTDATSKIIQQRKTETLKTNEPH